MVKTSRAEACPKGEVCRSKFIIASSVAPLPAGLDTLGSASFSSFFGGGECGGVFVVRFVGLGFFLQAPSLGSVS